MNCRRLDNDLLRAVGVSLFLLAASLVPSPLERHPDWEWVGPDKLLHLLGHAIYVVVLAESLDGSRRSPLQTAVLAVCLSTAHSLVTARLKAYVPGRMGEVGDVVAGLVGAVLAVSVWYRRVSPTRQSPGR